MLWYLLFGVSHVNSVKSEEGITSIVPGKTRAGSGVRGGVTTELDDTWCNTCYRVLNHTKSYGLLYSYLYTFNFGNEKVMLHYDILFSY